MNVETRPLTMPCTSHMQNDNSVRDTHACRALLKADIAQWESPRASTPQVSWTYTYRSLLTLPLGLLGVFRQLGFARHGLVVEFIRGNVDFFFLHLRIPHRSRVSARHTSHWNVSDSVVHMLHTGYMAWYYVPSYPPTTLQLEQAE